MLLNFIRLAGWQLSGVAIDWTKIFPGWELSGWEIFGWQFSEWEFSWVGVVRVGIFRVGVFLGGSCLGRTYPGWELSRCNLSWVGIVQVGLILGGNFLWWKFSRWKLSGGNHPGGSFHVTREFQKSNYFTFKNLFYYIIDHSVCDLLLPYLK